MKVPTLFIASLLFACAAIGAHLTSLGQIGRGASLIARASVASPSEKATLRAQAESSFRRAYTTGVGGLVCVLVSGAVALRSSRAGERAWPEITFCLWTVYLFLQFLLV